jgi:endonuclease/exonuclease/phosphatase family metal-dependent hydrolase
MDVLPPCPPATGSNPAVRWIGPESAAERERRHASCEVVGQVVVHNTTTQMGRAPGAAIILVSWNVAIGGGRIGDLLRHLQAEERTANRPEPDFILLLQEAFRYDSAPPTGKGRDDVLSIAQELRLNVAYVPARRHRPARDEIPGEDLGNAVLSTLPLRDVTAIDLPFVRQRRVAVAAGVDVDGSTLTVVTLHLSTRQPFLRGSILSAPFARERQAAALVEALSAIDARSPIIIGGDFNTIGGTREPAIRVMARQFVFIQCGSPITHDWGLSLDYLFASDASIVQDCGRLRQRYGSDHHPLVARVAVSR